MLIKIGNWAKRFVQKFNGFLDSYPNAAAAYSLRKLSATYSGSAVRVRRSSDDSELDIGFSGNELDQATLTAFVGSNDGFVTKWYDQSGNNVHATNLTSANQPKIVSSGSVILNSENKPVIRFIKENNYSLTLATSVLHKSIFVVCSADTANTDPTPPGLLSSATDGGSYIFISNNTSLYNGYAISVDGAVQDVGSWYQNGSFQATGQNLGTFGDIVSDQTYLHTIIYNPGSPFEEMIHLGKFVSVGTSYYYDGDISEFIIYSNDKSSNRIGIENNINTYWDIY